MVDYTAQIAEYLRKLFPIIRSITGEGNRQNLKILQEVIPLSILEFPSGQQVYDWIIPKEWNIKDAWIKNSRGEKIVDFSKSNLHVVGYSIPIYAEMKLSDLKHHLHFLEHLPEAIPYRTSYYQENWGFCLSYRDYQRYFQADVEYEVMIDSELKPGSLVIGELLIPGLSSKEYLISTYICHPSLANDNLSGMLLTAFLAKELLKQQWNFSYRIIFVPETIGAIAYCANNEDAMKKIDAGLVVSTVGGPGEFGYKQSFRPDHAINRIIESVFQSKGLDFITYPFDIHGSDERQYSSQGFRINMATISKDKYYEYDHYHTSLDNLDFVKPDNIIKSLEVYLEVISLLDKNLIFANLLPHCEVMLSKHNLYPRTGGAMLPFKNKDIDMILWLLFYANGQMSLWDISEKIGFPLEHLSRVARDLENKKILAWII
jgi:aminopeptidase-like protein